jgi:hypothetical protein
MMQVDYRGGASMKNKRLFQQSVLGLSRTVPTELGITTVVLVFIGGWAFAQEPLFGPQNIIGEDHSQIAFFHRNYVRVFVADLDGDGDMDVLSASEWNNKIAWYENDGGAPPNFTTNTISTNADGAISVHAADVDGDGDLDVLSASYNDNKVAWYENDGNPDPTFAEAVISSSQNGATSVFAIDFDNDGDIDVLSGGGSKIALHENNGMIPPAFATHNITPHGSDITCVYATDFDSDGDIDAVSASAGGATAWYENDGAAPPAFTGHPIVGDETDAQTVYAVDLDEDGDVDVLTAGKGRTSSHVINWFENDGTETFIRHVVADSGSWAVHTADMDGDGDLDILGGAGKSQTHYWYENEGGTPAVFTPQATYDLPLFGPWGTSLYAADLDGDGDFDTVEAVAGIVVWYENNGGTPPSFTYRVITDYPPFPVSVCAGDLDGDGSQDLVSGAFFDTELDWYRSDGASPPSFQIQDIPSYTLFPRRVHSHDLDTDGDLDILSVSVGDGKIAWYENDGSASFTENIISVSAEYPYDAYAADLDGDGDNDVITASKGDDTIAWFENDGAETFSEHIISTSAEGAEKIHAADLDGDGDIDVLSASADDNKIAWYENDGAIPPAFSERAISTNAMAAQSVYAVDLNGDGNMDVLSASYNDNKIAWYENDRSVPPAFTPHVISNIAVNPESVCAADLNVDGLVDVLCVGQTEIAWYENDGTSAFAHHTICPYPTVYQPQCVHAVDLDGDGDLDLVSASAYDLKIAWYENLLEPPAAVGNWQFYR